MVEFALVAPILILIVLGIFEYGNLWRQTGNLERIAQQAGRTVSAQATGRFADYEALRAIDALSSSLSGMTVERVVIYRATGDGEMPPACAGASQAGLCNRYTGAQVANPSPGGFSSPSAANPSCSPGSLDAAWCPTSRSRSGTTPDRIGVHITVRYDAVTNLLPTPNMTVERYAVYQIEPCAQGQTNC